MGHGLEGTLTRELPVEAGSQAGRGEDGRQGQDRDGTDVAQRGPRSTMAPVTLREGAPASSRVTVTPAPGDREAEVAALKARHRDIERRLSELGRHPAMTPAEQLECARLKKEKLAGKDRLALLARAAGAV